MANEGYVKLFRQMKNKAWYKDSEFVHLWIHLLLKANHSGAEFLHGNTIVKLNPGQFVTGRNQLSMETGVNSSKVERVLKVFENDKQIEQQTNNKNRVITIVSWDKYQKSEQQTNNGRTASEQQVNTNKNEKNNKEEINISFDVFWNEYDKKIGVKKNLELKWQKLKDEERTSIMQFIPKYKQAQPEKRFRKNPETFFNKRAWEDELVGSKSDNGKKLYSHFMGGRVMLSDEEWNNHPEKRSLIPV